MSTEREFEIVKVEAVKGSESRTKITSLMIKTGIYKALAALKSVSIKNRDNGSIYQIREVDSNGGSH